VERSHRIDAEEFYQLLDGVVIGDTKVFGDGAPSFVLEGLAHPDAVETLGVSADNQIIDVRPAAEASDLLDELPTFAWTIVAGLRLGNVTDGGHPPHAWQRRSPSSALHPKGAKRRLRDRPNYLLVSR
jgi:hypothetical protein